LCTVVLEPTAKHEEHTNISNLNERTYPYSPKASNLLLNFAKFCKIVFFPLKVVKFKIVRSCAANFPLDIVINVLLSSPNLSLPTSFYFCPSEVAS